MQAPGFANEPQMYLMTLNACVPEGIAGVLETFQGLGPGRMPATPHLEHAGVAGRVREGQRPQEFHRRRVHRALERDEVELRALSPRSAMQQWLAGCFVVCLACASGLVTSYHSMNGDYQLHSTLTGCHSTEMVHRRVSRRPGPLLIYAGATTW